MTSNNRQQRHGQLWRTTKRIMISTVALATAMTITATPMLSNQSIHIAYANSLDQALDVATSTPIRVALFLNLPGKYTNITNKATFSSAGGMQIGVKGANGAAPALLTVDKQQPVHISLHNYTVKVVETASFEVAQATLKQLQAAKGVGQIRQFKGSATYEVVEGAYETPAAATSALQRWQADAKLLGVTKQYKASVLGPHYIHSPYYATEEAAVEMAKLLATTGLPVAIGMTYDASTGKAMYKALVGAASSKAALKTIAQTVQKVAPNIAFVEDDAAAYMIVYVDFTNGVNSSAKTIALTDAASKVMVMPQVASSPIKLQQRSDREYRGAFEISTFNEKLAVINELPLEHYLYSVVAVEMYTGWPIEALKAQAVAARTFALQKGLNFQIAHVVDTTLSQVYNGVTVEHEATTRAVNETAGLVLKHNGKLIEALYSSNGGGVTADSTEAWGSSIPYLQSVKSPDQIAAQQKTMWYKVATNDNKVGFISEKNVKDNGKKSMAGSRVVEVSASSVSLQTNPAPNDTAPVIATLKQGVSLTILEEVVETNPMYWRREANDPAQLLAALNSRAKPQVTGPLEKLEVTKRGPSGRVLEVAVNGNKVALSSPDQFRSALGVNGSLPSTLFDLQDDSEYVVLGAAGKTAVKNSKTATTHIVAANNKEATFVAPYIYLLADDGTIRAISKKQAYSFFGSGYGHGVGMSQYGAYSLAEQGYDFKYILQHYYKGVAIEKD